ncbi:hypothetical protein K469DRAFT_76061 [Zopfia rhizophila CBS 207.26]|uniref:Uncharacterized protein n=1 Tax=Zopfia rhizophila CBS 207.26 TaxID=1314779 RepID=A0A6A6EEM2_9PEZI|nr:hypothetical protein K469DRAFT_76061 [Zopfia rhizophila CBS 207.26]
MHPVVQLSLVASGIGALQVTRRSAARSVASKNKIQSLKTQAAAIHTRPALRGENPLPSSGELLAVLGMNQFIDSEHLMYTPLPTLYPTSTETHSQLLSESFSRLRKE